MNTSPSNKFISENPSPSYTCTTSPLTYSSMVQGGLKSLDGNNNGNNNNGGNHNNFKDITKTSKNAVGKSLSAIFNGIGKKLKYEPQSFLKPSP